MAIKDSGNRREFDTGSVRDIAEGKGRCDLLPLDIIGELYEDMILQYISEYVYSGNPLSLEEAIKIFVYRRYNNNPYTAFLEVAKHYEDGALKYAERNWEKGIPSHCYIDSAVRHYLKCCRGDNDEPHDRAFLWNLLGALWTHKHLPEMIDLPFAEEEKEDEH